MKKLLSLLTLLLLLGGNAWADTQTFDYSNSGASNNWTQDPITVNGSSGSVSDNQLQFSTGGSSFSVSISSGSLTSVVVTYEKDHDDRTGGGSSMTVSDNNSVTTGYTYDSSAHAGTWTATGTPTSVTFTAVSSKKMRIASIVVTYSAASIVDPTANLGAPDYANGYTWDFTNLDLSNITVGGYWELDGTKYKNKTALSSANLIANNTYIPETKYLTFSATTANNLWLSNSGTYQYLAVSQHGSLKIPAVPSGKTVIIKMFTSGSSAVSATVTGASESSISTPSTANTPGYAYLTGMGTDITITPNGWMYFQTIEVVDLCSKTIPITGMNIFRYDNGTAGINANQITGRTLGGLTFTFGGGDGVKFNEKEYLRLRYSGSLRITPDGNNSTQNIYKIEFALLENAPATLSFTPSSGTLTRTSDKCITWEGDPTGSVTITGTSNDIKDGIIIENITIYTDGALSDTKQTPALTLSSTSVNKTTNDANTIVALPLTTTPSYFDAGISFDAGSTGSTWDANARTITVGNTIGTATVTVSYSGNDYYNTVASQTYTLTIGAAYTVSYTASPAGGTVGVSPTGSQAEGTEITITATPSAGYALGTVTVTDESNNTVATSGSGNTRTFTMPASNVTIAVTFVPEAVTFSPSSGEVASGTTVTLSTTATDATIYYTTDGSTPTTSSATYSTPISITATTTIRAIAVAGGVSSAISSASYTVSSVSSLQAVKEHDWTFDNFDTSSMYGYALEDDNTLEIFGTTGSGTGFAKSSTAISTSDGTESFNYYLKFDKVRYDATDSGNQAVTSNNQRYFHFKVNATADKTKVKLYASTGSNNNSRTANIAVGTFGNIVTTLTNSNSKEAAIAEYTFTTSGEQDVWIYAPTDGSAMQYYKILVYSDKQKLTTFRSLGGQNYTPTAPSKLNHTLVFEDKNAITANDLTNGNIEVTSSDPDVLDFISGTSTIAVDNTNGRLVLNNLQAKQGGTATLTIHFKGNDNYAEAYYTTRVFTVTGPAQFLIKQENQEIQQGQHSVITPIITDKNGKPIGIKETSEGSRTYTMYVLGEEEDLPDYSTYFDFTFTEGTGSGENYEKITVNSTTGDVRTEDDTTPTPIAAAVGAKRAVTVSATPKTAYLSAFISGDAVSVVDTLKIIAKVSNPQFDLYWDAACTEEYRITPTYDKTDSNQKWSISSSVATQDANKLWTFENFPNGRMIYVKPQVEGDSIWFSYAQDETAATIPANPSIDKKKRSFQYRRGIPVYINTTLTGESYVTVNIVATTYNSSTGKRNLDGSVARLRFNIVSHDRPGKPTYDPISPSSIAAENNGNRRIMNTSQNVVAYGEGANPNEAGPAAGNLVYGKFSTESVYKTEQLINERTVTSGINSVPVISTEVANRRFTAVQIKTYSSDTYQSYGEYISDTTYTEYYYKYDTEMRLTPTHYDINISSSTSSAPQTTVTWYNKRNYNNENATGVKQEVDSYENMITYEIVNRNGAEGATVDSSTGIVTASTNPGWIRVKVKYLGGEQHGGKSGEPQYVSTTDSTAAYFYVYITDPSTEEPIITPPTRKFTTTLSYKITAPSNWDVYYTTDGTTPAYGTGTYLKHGSSSEGVATATTTIRAIAYNPTNTEQTSRVVSETYTKVDPIPDPVFDPNGVPSPWYYNTNSLTVQIACSYAGSVIYYTTDGSNPEIGADNTYKYSGLSKVVISGNVAIKAVAYSEADDLYSNVVTSNYIYSSEMTMPYFQASNDGLTWYGFNSSGEWTSTEATAWNTGQSHTITPSTQIRIVDPNNVTGTIYYTLDGSTPADNSNSMIFTSHPFTLAKTTTGKAIVTLEEASSSVASAVFTIDSSYPNVWEAVEQTTPGGLMKATDGFVITTKNDLAVQNTGTNVNLNSIDDAHDGYADVMYAQPGITATFGGFDLKTWTYMTLADDAIGQPIDAVGSYTIKNNEINNARDEYDNAYYHVYTYKKDATKVKGTDNTITTHEKTFKLPAMGSYVRFEPEQDGDLTIWCLQQGSLLYEEDKWFVPNVLRLRPVYLLDEQGNSIPVKVVNGSPQMWSSARLSEKWADIQATAAQYDSSTKTGGWKNSQYDQSKKEMSTDNAYCQWIRKSDGEIFQEEPSDFSADKYKKITNKGPNTEETAAIYDMYNTYLTTNGINIGDQLQPFAIHTTGASISLNDGSFIEDSEDGTGYVLATGGYAKYTFPVKAGKTYFFTAQATKIGIRGFQFVPTEDGTGRHAVTITKTGTTYTVDGDEKTPAEAVAACADKPANVTLSGRTFQADTWASLVLPFSVSVAQVEKVFGAHTDIVHFNDITEWGNDAYKLYLKRHWHKMIVAGTPILIKPTQNVTDPVFTGVRMEASEVVDMTASTVSDQYSMTGVLVKTNDALKQNDYYINTSGQLTRMKNTSSYVNSTYAWIKSLQTGSAAKTLTVGFTSFENDMEIDDETTGIQVALFEESGINTFNTDDTIYNLNGVKVGDGSSMQNLPKGIYIVKGKKVIIK